MKTSLASVRASHPFCSHLFLKLFSVMPLTARWDRKCHLGWEQCPNVQCGAWVLVGHYPRLPLCPPHRQVSWLPKPSPSYPINFESPVLQWAMLFLKYKRAWRGAIIRKVFLLWYKYLILASGFDTIDLKGKKKSAKRQFFMDLLNSRTSCETMCFIGSISLDQSAT